MVARVGISLRHSAASTGQVDLSTKGGAPAGWSREKVWRHRAESLRELNLTIALD